MAALDQVKRAIKESSELSQHGENLSALALLDEAIASLGYGEDSSISVCILTRHASVIAEQLGDLRLVRQYREQVLAHDPDNPLALLSFAGVLHQQGEKTLAEAYARRSYQLSKDRGTELDRAVMESIAKTWPDISGPLNE